MSVVTRQYSPSRTTDKSPSLSSPRSRREDKLRIPNGWLCHLAPEIIQQLSPDTEEDKLPFSKQSDVFAFG